MHLEPTPNGGLVAANVECGDSVTLGMGTVIWSGSQIRSSASIGSGCIIGRGCYIGVAVTVGDNCKIQNHALVYEPAQIGNAVFIGPGVILTNDRLPRAVTPSGERKGPSDWEASAVVIEDYASIGAGSICVAPVTIGRYAMVGAGSVVTKSVAPHSLVIGVPARHVGWVGRSGSRLIVDGSHLRCPDTDDTYIEVDGILTLLEGGAE